MRNTFKALAVLAALSLPLTVVAKPGQKPFDARNFTAADGTSFATEDMTGPAQTSVMDVRGMQWVTFYLSVAAVSGTANVTVNCSVGPTAATVLYPLQSESVSAGVATFSAYVPTKSFTTSGYWPLTISVLNKGYLQCTFTCASGTVDATAYAW